MTMKKRGAWLAAVAAAALLAAGCNKPAESKPAVSAEETAKANGAAWTKLVNDFIEDDFKANPDNAVYLGRHEFDGQLPDWSEAGLTAENKRLHAWRDKFAAVDVATLPADLKLEHDYTLAVLDGRLFWRETADWPHKNPQFYGLDPAVFLDRPYADPATRMKAYTKWASNIPAATAQIKAALKGPLPKAYIDIGMHTFGPTGDFLKKDVPAVFKGVGDDAARAAFEKANADAAKAFADLNAYLGSLRKTQVDKFAMGPELFAKMVSQTERVDTPLDQLEAIGEADLKRNLEALAEACKAYAPGKSTKQCVDKAAASKPEGGDFVGYARKQLVDLKKFIQDHNVVTIPSEEEAKVKQSPPYNAQNGAYIDPPQPYEKNMPAFYNISPPDKSWSKAKQLAYIPSKGNLLFTSVHEVWPGHFLQFLHANRSKSQFGRVYVGYAFAEGWAHYTEEMMWEEGLGAGDPETHIGQLSEALLRNVRFLSAIGMHTKGMTLAESKAKFIKDGQQDEGSAEQQAARGAYDPAYLNYTMGKLMIRKLRADWCAAKGKGPDKPEFKTCWKDFHDAFLAYGGPPIPLVRAAMMNEPVAAKF